MSEASTRADPPSALRLHAHLARVWRNPTGWRSLSAVNHNVVGRRFIFTALTDSRDQTRVPRRTATAVITSCRRPPSAVRNAAASPASRGLPRIRRPRATVVSAQSTMSSSPATTAAAFSRARRAA